MNIPVPGAPPPPAAGDRPPGDHAPGDHAPGDHAAGDRPPGAGDRPPGDHAPGDRPPSAGDRAPGAPVTPTRQPSPVVAQIKAETLMTLRRGESLLLTLGIPIVLLAFFDLIGYPDRSLTGGVSTIAFLAPGILALAVMSTGMVSLGIATAFERQYGVLKRLGTTPLGRPALLTAKAAAIFVVEILQIIVLWIAAVLMGWQPRGDVMVFLALVVLATAGFAGIGLLMAGTLRAEMTLAAANGLYLVLLLLGGMVVPLSKLPGPVQAVARALPAANLADAFHATLGLGNAVPGRAWLVLLAWAVAAPLAAALTFRWE